MHPQISIVPRKQFYSDGDAAYSLEDGKGAGEGWDYHGISEQRAVWINVKRKKQVKGNKNFEESEEIERQLSSFIKWSDGKNPPDGRNRFEVAVLTFYKGQESVLREMLRRTSRSNSESHFQIGNVYIKLATVDYFQGQEADLVFLSMVNNDRDGFLDTPNRLNVAVTRARKQMVIVGYNSYFRSASGHNNNGHHSKSPDLNALANEYELKEATT